MDILKILGLKNDTAQGTDQKAAPAPEEKKPNPHAHGGCCGSCGGQKQH